MKKIIYPLALFLFLAAFGSPKAQEIHTETVVATSEDDDEPSLRQNIDRPISQLIVNGKSAVMLVYDTTNFIEVDYNSNETNPLERKWVIVRGTTLTIDDPEGYAIYVVHLKKDELQSVKNNSSSPIIYVSLDNNSQPTDTVEYGSTGNLARQQQIEEAQQQLDKARRELVNEIIEIEPIYVDAPDYNPDTSSDNSESTFFESTDNHYDWEDRTGTSLLWGFNNWGSNWFNGLNKMDGAYELRTSFSSWQFELSYAVIMTRHFYLDLGIGYESDIYKFNAPLVNIDNNGSFVDFPNSNYSSFISNNQLFDNTHLEDWSSRLVTRYFCLPIDIVFRFNNYFKIGFAAIPALAFTSNHTGLKHEINTRNIEYQDVENISKFINPYKLDVRFSMRFNHFGIFAQVATMSLFKDKDVYPIKIGFIIK